MIHCRIITPEKIYKELDSDILNIETLEGQQGILSNHMPIVAKLKVGRLGTNENGERKEYAISGGLIYFRNNEAEILTDAIESSDEIDVDRAKAAKDRAEKRIESHDGQIDIIRAQAALSRALNRLRISQHSIQ